MQCKELEFVLESEGLGPLPLEAREHLAGCSACQGYLADLNSIVLAAKTLPAEVAPPDRIWISLRAQLEAEGLIKEPVAVPEPSSWWENFGAWLRPRTLATASAAFVLVAIAVFVARMPYGGQTTVVNNPPAQQDTRPTPPQPAPPVPAPPTATVSTTITAKRTPPKPIPSRVNGLAPSPSDEASLALNIAERDVPDMELAGNSQVDAALRGNLRTLNEFIAECEKHLKQNPQDQLAREYLNAAYQQKADLLAAMMDSGRSEH